MSITVNFFGTADGIQSDIGIYRWNGHSFNPTGDKTDGYQTWNPWVDSWSGYALYSPTGSFDLTGFYYGNEVVLAGIKFSTSINDSGTVIIRFKDPNGDVLFEYSYNWSGYAGYWIGTWAGMGVKANGYEIWNNGNYTAEYDILYSGSLHSTGSVNFTVTNYPTAVEAAGDIGSIWVEGSYLCFICYQGFKIRVSNDGSSSHVGTDKAGAIWLETDSKISYVDEYGYKRFTKKGDRYGWLGSGEEEIPSSPGVTYKGYIWVSTSFDDTYLMIISENGIKYRIGAGYVFDPGDYQ